LFLGGDGSAEESAKTEKAVVFVQRDRGRGAGGKDVLVARKTAVFVNRRNDVLVIRGKDVIVSSKG